MQKNASGETCWLFQCGFWPNPNQFINVFLTLFFAIFPILLNFTVQACTYSEFIENIVQFIQVFLHFEAVTASGEWPSLLMERGVRAFWTGDRVLMGEVRGVIDGRGCRGKRRQGAWMQLLVASHIAVFVFTVVGSRLVDRRRRGTTVQQQQIPSPPYFPYIQNWSNSAHFQRCTTSN